MPFFLVIVIVIVNYLTLVRACVRVRETTNGPSLEPVQKQTQERFQIGVVSK